LVEQYTLRRRDPRIGDRVVLKPRGPGDLDLHPLAWLVVKMLRKPDDGNTHAYAAVLIRYLELRELVPRLRPLLRSRHPAVSDKARWGLEELADRQDPRKSRRVLALVLRLSTDANLQAEPRRSMSSTSSGARRKSNTSRSSRMWPASVVPVRATMPTSRA